MRVFIGIAYFLIGLLQLFAIADGVRYGAGLGKFLSMVAALLLTYIPLVGSIMGVYGAHNAWHWPLWQAAGLFFWYIPVLLVLWAFERMSSR